MLNKKIWKDQISIEFSILKFIFSGWIIKIRNQFYNTLSLFLLLANNFPPKHFILPEIYILIRTTFFEKKFEKKWKSTRVYKKTRPQKRGVPSTGTPTMQNNTYRIVIKSLRNWSPQRNMNTNERPSLTSVPLHTSKNPTIALSSYSPQNSIHPCTPERGTLLPTRQVEKRLLDQSTNISVPSNHNAKRLEKRIPSWTSKLTMPKNMVQIFLCLLTKYNKNDQQAWTKKYIYHVI